MLRSMLTLFGILLALSAARAQDCPQDEKTAFCVVYQHKVQNLWANECMLKAMPNVTVLRQNLCTTVPNAQ
jgi:hypothetical protein